MNKDELLNIYHFSSHLRFPSISADSTKKEAVQGCATWLYHHLKSIGLQTVKMFATPLHTIVYEEHIVNPAYQTILFYGHYDVQPVTPIQEWKTPPFEPVIKDDYIYARGASDDKGQLFIHVKAIEQLLKKNDSVPVNIKCLFEGEEEIGSPHLEAFIKANKDMLRCNVAVVSDTKMLSANQPAITYSLRGSLNLVLTIKREGKEGHSGTFGGMIQNPADVISSIVAAMRGTDETINIPNFYNDVITVDWKERAYMKQNGSSDMSILQEADTKKLWGEKGYSNYERTTIRPSLVISSISCGYQREGIKNVIPTEATIKMNIRLVPDQKPEVIAGQLSFLVKHRLPRGFFFNMRCSSMVKPVEVPKHNPYIRAAAAAYQAALSKAPVFLRSGGTIPIVSMFKEILQVPTVLMGFALATDDMHAPNEKFYLPNFFKGIQTSFQFMKNIALITQNTGTYATPHH